MSTLNRVFVTGNLVRDPELRRLPSGSALCNACVAVSEKFEGKDGNMVERTVFLEFVVWEQQAEWCGQNLRKGDRITLEGSLQQDNWTDDKGNKRTKIKARADRVHFLSRGGRKDGGAAGSEEEPAPASRRPAPPPAPDKPPRPTGNPGPTRRTAAPIFEDAEA